MKLRSLLLVGLGLAVAMATGCSLLLVSDETTGGGESPLRAALASPDAVTLDIFWANLPAEGYEFDARLWRFVQEDRVDPELRGRLMQNGLRAGVVGGAPPEVIVRMLDPQGKKRRQAKLKQEQSSEVSEDTDDPAAEQDQTVAALNQQTGVRARTTQVRPGEPVVVQASKVYDEAIILHADRTGETYRQVQAIYSLEVHREPTGAYSLRVTPELHMGSPRAEWVRDETNMIAYQKMEREKQAFDDLRIEAPLVVGEMLLVTSLPDASSRLGRYFHEAEDSPEGRRKAILVRLTGAPPDPAFGAERDAR